MSAPHPRPLWQPLAAFLLVNALAVNLLLPVLPLSPQKTTTLDYTAALFRGIAHHDSWLPMRAALLHVHRDEAPLYATVFFEERTKFQYPPTSLVLLEPLAHVRGGVADRVLNGISLGAVAAVALALAALLWRADESLRGAPPSPVDRAALALLAVVAVLTYYPIVRGVYLGQIQTWIDAAVAGALWLWVAGRERASGVLVALACAIKPTLGGLLLWGLVRREWRFAQGFTLAGAALLGTSLALYGLGDHLGYLEVLGHMSRHGESFHANQSVGGLLHRALGNGPNLDFEADAFAPYHPLVYAGSWLSSLALMAGALVWRRPAGEATRRVDLAIACTTFTLASPIVWEHHYGVLLPVFALALPVALAGGRRPRAVLAAALAGAYVLTSNNFRLLNRLAETAWNPLQSYVLFGGLLLLFVLYALRGRAAQEAGA